jgi:hypothetical protein
MTARSMLLGCQRSTTMIGRSLSMQSEMAVLSSTPTSDSTHQCRWGVQKPGDQLMWIFVNGVTLVALISFGVDLYRAPQRIWCKIGCRAGADDITAPSDGASRVANVGSATASSR